MSVSPGFSGFLLWREPNLTFYFFPWCKFMLMGGCNRLGSHCAGSLWLHGGGTVPMSWALQRLATFARRQEVPSTFLSSLATCGWKEDKSLFCPIFWGIWQWKTAQNKGVSPCVWRSRSEFSLAPDSGRLLCAPPALRGPTNRSSTLLHVSVNTFLHCSLSLLPPGPLSAFSWLPVSALLLPWSHYLPATPTLVLPKPTYVGQFNKWCWDFLQVMSASLPRGILKWCGFL